MVLQEKSEDHQSCYNLSCGEPLVSFVTTMFTLLNVKMAVKEKLYLEELKCHKQINGAKCIMRGIRIY